MPYLDNPLPLIRVRSEKELAFTPVITVRRCFADIGGGAVRLEAGRYYRLPNATAERLLAEGLAVPAEDG